MPFAAELLIVIDFQQPVAATFRHHRAEIGIIKDIRPRDNDARVEFSQFVAQIRRGPILVHESDQLIYYLPQGAKPPDCFLTELMRDENAGEQHGYPVSRGNVRRKLYTGSLPGGVEGVGIRAGASLFCRQKMRPRQHENMFEANYQPLSVDHPEWGIIAVLPWDSETFGFAAADYKPGDVRLVFTNREDIRYCLGTWAKVNTVEIVGCSVAASEPRWRTLLPRIGFAYVDSTLTYTVSRLERAQFPRKRVPVRLATAEDQPAVERICEIGFRAGRYHADALFPVALANLRYRKWLANEFASLSGSNRIYVVGDAGEVIGFTHVRVNGEEAYITIGGADPAVQSGVLPFAVFIGTLEALRDSGVRRVQSKLSAGNTPMLNLAAYAGSRFSEPEAVFHWHAENAPHLNRFSSLFL